VELALAMGMIVRMQYQRDSFRRLRSLCLSLVTVGALACSSPADDSGGSATAGDMGTGGSAGSTSNPAGTGGNVAAAGSTGTGGGSAGTTGSGGGQVVADASTGTAGSMMEGGMPVATDAGLAVGTHTARPVGKTASNRGYWEYLPKGYGNGIPSPLLVFMHGHGENGSGDATALNLVLLHGPPKLIKANQWPADRPFVVLSFQESSPDCPSATTVHDFLAFALGNYAVDPKRVYLTGLSCGAIGSSAYFAQYGGDVVAATALIAGNSSPIWNAKMCPFLTQTALWAFHGDVDASVNISDDNMTMPKFMACPKPPKTDAQYTVYPGGGHDVWTRTYDLSAGHDIYKWMLTFSH
jgi:poly(3-hydroxybutyrate) depolymerase